MKRHIHNARDLILPIIDFFYPPFRRLMNLQTFRYAASGGANTLFGFFIYFISYKYILEEKELHFGFYAFKAHIAALFISFCVTFPDWIFYVEICGLQRFKNERKDPAFPLFHDMYVQPGTELYPAENICRTFPYLCRYLHKY